MRDLKADADGIVTATFGEPGQVVPVGQPVIRLAQRGEKEAVVALPETWLADARKSKATVRLWSDRERSFNAALRELSPQADAASRTYAARFTIEDADDTVALGMTATVTLAQRMEAPVARAAALRDSQPRHRPDGLSGRPGRRADSARRDGRVVHRGCGAGHLGPQSRRAHRDARRAEARSRPEGSHDRTLRNVKNRGDGHAALQPVRMGHHAPRRSCCS